MYSAKPLLEKVVKRNKKVAVVFKKKKKRFTPIQQSRHLSFRFSLSFCLFNSSKSRRERRVTQTGDAVAAETPQKKKRGLYTKQHLQRKKKKKKKKKKMKQKENAKERRRSSGEKRKQFDMLSKR